MIKKVLYGRKLFSPKVQAILKKVGNSTIRYISIGRKPVSQFITGF